VFFDLLSRPVFFFQGPESGLITTAGSRSLDADSNDMLNEHKEIITAAIKYGNS
jgi:hypothetical protein